MGEWKDVCRRTAIKAGELVAFEHGEWSDRTIAACFRFTCDVDLEPLAREAGIWDFDHDFPPDDAWAAFTAAIQRAGAEEIQLAVISIAYGLKSS